MIGFDLPPPTAIVLSGIASLPRATMCALMEMLLSGEIFPVLAQLEQERPVGTKQSAPNSDHPLAGHMHVTDKAPRIIISVDESVFALEAENDNYPAKPVSTPAAPAPMFTVVRSFGGVEITEGIPFLEFDRAQKVAALRSFLPTVAKGDVTIGLGYNLGPIEALMLGNHPQFLDS